MNGVGASSSDAGSIPEGNTSESGRKRVTCNSKNSVARTGINENRVTQALRAARQQVRLAQAGAGRRMQDVLTELDHILEDQIVAIANAAVDDSSDAELAGNWPD